VVTTLIIELMLTLVSWRELPDQGKYGRGKAFPRKPEWEGVDRGYLTAHAIDVH